MNFLENLYGNFYFSQNLQEGMPDGAYELVFREKVAGIKALADFLVPGFKVGGKYTDSNGRIITITSLSSTPNADGNYVLGFDLVNGTAKEDKAGFWIEGIFVLAGLALALFTVVEIRKMVPKTVVNIIVIVVGGLLLYALYQVALKKLLKSV